MAQKSRFYDSVASDRVYASAAWADVVGGLIGDGVVATGNELAVVEASPPAMSVRVDTGKAFTRGYYFEVHGGLETLTISAADATNPRIDRVVVRRDLTGRTALLAVLAGTPAASPTAPALTQVEAGIWEISLAQVAVAAGATSIVNANITDERGARAEGPDIANLEDDLLDTATGHRHEGTAGTGRKVRHADLASIVATDHHAAPVAGPDADITRDAAGAAGTASTFARSQHGHKLDTSAVAGAATTIDDAAGAGTAGAAPSRGDHGHRVDTQAAAGATVTIDDPGVSGSQGSIARGGHGHRVDTIAAAGADTTIDSVGVTGGQGSLARSGHGHRVNTTAGPGADVAVDAAGAAGSTGALARAGHGHKLVTSGATPSPVGTAGVDGTTGAVSRADHIHAHPDTGSFLPNAHHAQSHALNSHTGSLDSINAWEQGSAGGGAAGVKIWVGTTDPGASAAEGDVWVQK